MTNPNDSASFSFTGASGYGDAIYIDTPTGRTWIAFERGLTKREYFAAMAMQGILSNTTVFNGELYGNHDISNHDFIAAESVLIAEALINQLNK